MKKTREGLRKWVQTHTNRGFCPDDLTGFVNRLIEEGWVEIYKPKEFWIIEGCAFPNYEEATIRQNKQKAESELYEQIIHVREVVENE